MCAARDNMLQVVSPFFNPQNRILQMKLSQTQNEMKSFGEKLIEVANVYVSHFSYFKLNSVDPDVKKEWSILGGPWTRKQTELIAGWPGHSFCPPSSSQVRNKIQNVKRN